jgi:predicted nucleic acid-binding protein
MIVADTGAVLALLDADEQHHVELREVFERAPHRWLLPWAILPEVDYLAATRLGAPVAQAFLRDLAEGAFAIATEIGADLPRAYQLHRKYRALKLGLVDAIVLAIAERVGAEAIATLDLKHFGAVTLKGNPRLFPRDLRVS